MSPISRGFFGHRRSGGDPSRVPPGQHVTDGFPVLSAGPTPHTPLPDWSFTIDGAVEKPVSWRWEEFLALAAEQITVDIHCVTKWTKLDTSWRGVPVETLLKTVKTEAEIPHGLVRRRLYDEPGARGRRRWQGVGRLRVRGRTDTPRARRSGTAAGPAPVLLEERKVGSRSEADADGRTRVLGDLRLPQPRRPMAGAALPGRLSWQLGRVVDTIEETQRAKSLVLDLPNWPGHRAGQHVDIRLTADDGYQAQRGYSIASAPEDDGVTLTIDRLEGGEVSPYLTDVVKPGDELELRGPIGGYFVWEASLPGPLLLISGGSGIVPLRAMLRHWAAARAPVEVRMVHSARSLDDVIYRDELMRLGGL